MTKRNIVHIEIPTRNVKESADFYHELFGWNMTSIPEMEYTTWKPGAEPGGGFSPLGDEVKVGDVLIYVDSEDIEADLKKVEQLGGVVLHKKSEIPGVGWYGIFKDLTGNMIALYTSKNPDFNK